MSRFNYDTFTDTAGTALTSHAPNTGGSWAVNSAFGTSNAVISNANRVRANINANSIFYCNGTPATADYDVQCDVFVASNVGNFGIIGRASTNAATYYLLDYEQSIGAWRIYTLVGGSNVNLTNSAAYPLTVGQTYNVRLSMRGTKISAYVNDVRVIQITDSNVTQVGKAGLFFLPSTTPSDSVSYHVDNFAAVDAGATSAVNGTNFFFSPANWNSDGSGTIQPNNILPSSTFARTANCGAYFVVRGTFVDGGYCYADLDTTTMTGITANACPRVIVAVDGVKGSPTLLAAQSGVTQLVLAKNLTAGDHTFKVYFQGVLQNTQTAMGDRWTNLTTGASCVKVTGIEFDAAATITAPVLQPKRLLVFGDSITEGCDAVGSANGPGDQDSTVTYAMLLAATLDAEVGVVGNAYQGYEAAGSGNTPNFPTAYNNYASGLARNWTNAFDYVIDNQGTNGTTIASDVQTMMENLRAVAPNAILIKTQTFGHVASAALSAGIANYQTAHPSDRKIFFVNFPTASLVNVTNSNDNLHPNVTGHQAYANGLAPLILADIASLNSSTQSTIGLGITSGLGF
jgi:lysophospholipase L1-like esterase